MSRIFCQNFLSRIIEKLRRGNFLCFTKFLVSKSFMEKKEGGRTEVVSRFSVDILWSPVSKIFVGGSFSASFISCIEKCQVLERGIRIFCQKFFVSVSEKSQRNPLVCH